MAIREIRDWADEYKAAERAMHNMLVRREALCLLAYALQDRTMLDRLHLVHESGAATAYPASILR